MQYAANRLFKIIIRDLIKVNHYNKIFYLRMNSFVGLHSKPHLSKYRNIINKLYLKHYIKVKVLILQRKLPCE